MIELKRGDTLSFLVIRKDEAGLPLTGDAANLKSEVRDKNDKLYGTFVITETATLGTYLFEISSTITDLFPITVLYFDIQYKDGDTVQSSYTDEITVYKDVTR